MRGRLLGVLLPAAALLLVGCASSPAAGTEATATYSGAAPTVAPVSTATASVVTPAASGADSSSMIYGLVTDSDQQGLVARACLP